MLELLALVYVVEEEGESSNINFDKTYIEKFAIMR